jgi:hypothetical protein
MSFRKLLIIAACLIVVLAVIGGIFWWFGYSSVQAAQPYSHVATVAGFGGELGEPFGIAVRDEVVYFSDGQSGKIYKTTDGTTAVFAEGFETPSAIAFDEKGNLLVADSGAHVIKSVNPTGAVTTVAGSPGKPGFADGDAANALFRAPIGVAAAGAKIYVADTYNDRIRVIEDGRVTTLAGSAKGFADGATGVAKFDTPSGIAVWNENLVVADTANRRIRVIEPEGTVRTLAGGSDVDESEGLPLAVSFYQPTGIAVDDNGSILVADANGVKMIGGLVPVVRTLAGRERGLADGSIARSRFNRPSGVATAADGKIFVADSENRLVRVIESAAVGREISAEEKARFEDKVEQFRAGAPARWPYDPPAAKRDIAGTLGEIRCTMTPSREDVWFHNGLDIAGSLGETARFIRDEKVLRPLAAENFGTLRELVRMPTLGYIHIRLGRDQSSQPFGDPRFVFEQDASGKLSGVRVPRGSAFKAGEPIGTLNPMNHVHLIAGRSGSEMNALAALELPGVSDGRTPVIENLWIYDQNDSPVETVLPNARISLRGKVRVVARAYDQMDGNSERRRLGVYKLNCELFRGSERLNALGEIEFARMPASAAIPFVYANGSHSGATGETKFDYIVTNFSNADGFREGWLDAGALPGGDYKVVVTAQDFFGNAATRSFSFEVGK